MNEYFIERRWARSPESLVEANHSSRNAYEEYVRQLEYQQTVATKDEKKMLRGDVRFHREGDKFAISTNAETERDFLDGAAKALSELVASADELGRWLPLIVDISAKMRGYKADVIEKRLIVAGAWLPSDVTAVVSQSQGQPDRELVTA